MAQGTWEPGFDEVVTTLDAQVADSGGGAAICVYDHGRPVVEQRQQSFDDGVAGA